MNYADVLLKIRKPILLVPAKSENQLMRRRWNLIAKFVLTVFCNKHIIFLHINRESTWLTILGILCIYMVHYQQNTASCRLDKT